MAARGTGAFQLRENVAVIKTIPLDAYRGAVHTKTGAPSVRRIPRFDTIVKFYRAGDNDNENRQVRPNKTPTVCHQR